LQYWIPASGGGKLGALHDRSDVVIDPSCPSLLGATLELATVGCALVEKQIGAIFSSGRIPQGVSIALFLYLGCPGPPGSNTAVELDTLENLLDRLARTRLGLQKEMKEGTLEIRQTDPSYGTELRGYVAKNFFGKMGPIHLAFNRIVAEDLYYSGAFSANLLFHEATHRYVQTVDDFRDPDEPSGKLSGYYPRPQRGKTLLESYQTANGSPSEKRKLIAGSQAAKITPKEAWNNADSLSFFLQLLLEDSVDCLPDALTGQARDDFTDVVQRFETVQRQLLNKNPVIKALGFKNQVDFLRVA
jgi:hypothetical protein